MVKKPTLLLATIALAFSGAVLAGGEYGKESATKSKDKSAKDLSVQKIDRSNAVQAFNQADQNSDFKLNKSEAAKIEGLKKKFSELDSDGDAPVQRPVKAA